MTTTTDSTPQADAPRDHYDVVILGGGLAGLTLARHLLLDTGRSVLLVERRRELPPKHQKVGESSVQLAGNYLSKVLDLEEHLLHSHFMKYNLRFYWKSAGRSNAGLEDFGQGYIRPFSNVASYQLDRNVLEGELLDLAKAEPRFTLATAAKQLEVDLGEEPPHRLSFEVDGRRRQVSAGWVVDTTGRGRLLARRRGLARSNPIRHAAFFWWVDGLVDVERLTGRSRREVRVDPARRALGHLPLWLATNHFMGEGFWFWVIPLRGKTSLGLVYDHRSVPHDEIFSVEKATDWVCREFPLFARDLPHRRVLDWGGYRDFSHDCRQTIDAAGWAMAGEAGRFTDPLYSPGSDLIAIYNTLIVDVIETSDAGERAAKCQLYEHLMRAVYEAYVPSYAASYDALGDQEVFTLKYAWELTIYFAGYVFPFLNGLFTDRSFVLAFLRLFSRLGPVNRGLQQLLSDYFQWKKVHRPPAAAPTHFDFTELGWLRRAERTFYEIDLSAAEAKRILAAELKNVEELARFVTAHVAASVVGDRALLTSRAFVGEIDLQRLEFDPEGWRTRWHRASRSSEVYPWSSNPFALDPFGEQAGASEPAEPALTNLG